MYVQKTTEKSLELNRWQKRRDCFQFHSVPRMVICCHSANVITDSVHTFDVSRYTVCPKKNYNRTFRINNFQSLK